MDKQKEQSLQRRTLYMFMSTSIVLVYLILYSFMTQPSLVSAQTTCFMITLEECNTSPTCTPVCDSGVLSAVRTIGYTAGPYGVPIRAMLCFDNFN